MDPEFALKHMSGVPVEPEQINTEWGTVPGEVTRADIDDMSDRQMLAEILTIMRGIGDVASEVAPQVLPLIDSITKNPMFKALGRMG